MEWLFLFHLRWIRMKTLSNLSRWGDTHIGRVVLHPFPSLFMYSSKIETRSKLYLMPIQVSIYSNVLVILLSTKRNFTLGCFEDLRSNFIQPISYLRTCIYYLRKVANWKLKTHPVNIYMCKLNNRRKINGAKSVPIWQ